MHSIDNFEKIWQFCKFLLIQNSEKQELVFSIKLHSALTPHPSSLVSYPLGRIPYPLGRIPYPLGRIPYPLGCISYPLGHIPYPLTPYPLYPLSA